MKKLLLKVENVFSMSQRRLILAPDIPLEHKPPQTQMIVTLKRPDSSVIMVEATFHVPHFQISDIEALLEHLKNEPRYVCVLKGVEKSEVPNGTEIWLNSE
jgi:hypothetical protein